MALINIKANFEKAKNYRKEVDETSSYKPAKKLRLADLALDSMQLVIGELIQKVEVLENENK